jgi:DNA (cytosine-5)-methyltransferase 1
MMRVLDLFSGIGGFSLGLERTGGFETVAFCEIDPFCRRVLKKHWPEVPVYEDVRELTAAKLAADGIGVDVICGGFPCQPFSTASAGKRVAPSLWPAMRALVRDVRPSVIILENVAELALRLACAELDGYNARPFRVGADDGGADHKRDRWWACAYANDKGELHRPFDAKVARLQEICAGLWSAANYARAIRVPDGLPNRVERNRALGNAVMPQIPELIGNAILASLHHNKANAA